VRFDSAWAFHYVPATGWVVFTVSQGTDRGEVFLASGDLRDGKWHHIAVVFSVSREYEMRLFLDGYRNQSSNLGNTPFSWGDGPIYVGAWARQDSAYTVKDRNFDGMLDEIRFSDAALDTESFVVNFGPLLFPPIAAEAYAAFELTFEGEAGKIYRIEQIDAETGQWERIGYADAERGSFFHRRDFFAPPVYRVVLNEPGTLETVAFSKFEAIELRFPTDAGQLYLIKRCETLNCVEGEQTFLLGDGAKMSYFERTVPNQSRFYNIERY
jgi:hypothetical protein